jgi:hypothetical protein
MALKKLQILLRPARLVTVRNCGLQIWRALQLGLRAMNLAAATERLDRWATAI